MKKIFLVVSLIISMQLNLSAQWETQVSRVTVDLIDVCFVDSLNGWIIGDSSTILATNDGGENWIKQIAPVDTFTFSKVQFVTQKVGFIIGNQGLLLKSNDGGLNWIKTETGYNYNFSDISFVDSLNGWLSCWLETKTERIGVILHTSDGGETWGKQVEKISNQLFGSTLFMAIEFQNVNIGWAFAGDYADGFSETFVYYTNDSGINWNIIGQPHTGPLREIHLANKNVIWGSKWQFTISYNGGRDWDVPDNDIGDIGSTAPIDELTGWSYIFNFNNQSRKIYFTTDGGNSWSEKLDLGQYSIKTIENFKDEILWVVGSSGIIKRWLKNPTNIETKKNKLNNNFHLYQNYPNPFNPTTKIKYNLPFNSKVDVTIYDIMGREVKCFSDISNTSGSYELEWDGTNNYGEQVSSGIYLMKFNANSIEGNNHNFTKTMKLMLLK